MRWIILVASLLACGSSLAQDRNKAASRKDKIKELCAARDWETAEAYALAEIASLDSRIPANLQSGGWDSQAYTPLRHEYTEVLTQLAAIQNAQGRFKDAKNSAERAILVTSEFTYFGDEIRLRDATASRAYALQQKGISLFRLKDYVASQTALEEATRLASESRPPSSLNADHPDTAIILIHLVDALLAQDKKAEAKPHLQRAVVIFEEKLGPDHEKTKDARAKLDGLKEQKRPIAIMAE